MAIGSVCGGLLLFLLTYAGVLHAIVAPPPGYQPAFSEQTLDMGAYYSWLADSETRWLLPNRHVPYTTEPALFQPTILLIAKSARLLHIHPMAVFYVLQILTFIGGVYALLFCGQTYLKTRGEAIAAACIVVCSLPFFMYLYGVRDLLPLPKELGMLGVVAYAYQSSDGLFRAGLSNGPNLTFGTMTMLLAFGYLGRFVQSWRHADFVGLSICAFANALFHPFEVYVFVITAVATIAVLRYQEGRLRSVLPLAGILFASTAIGMMPYLVQTARSQWLKDASDSNQFLSSPAFVLAYFGLPTFAVAYLLLLRWRMKENIDLVLRLWVLISCLLLLVPAIPCGIHLFDGYVYGQAFLLVRRARQDAKLPLIFQRLRRPALGLAYGLVAFSTFTIGAMWFQIYRDGVSPEPDFLNAIQSNDEARMLAWLKSNAPPETLVLAPDRLAPWIPSVSLNTFGSHDVLSVRYEEQIKLLAALYSGKVPSDQVQAFLQQYGFRYAIVPTGAKLAAELPGVPIQRFGRLDLYEFPGGAMKPYPTAGMAPERGRNSMRQFVLRAISSLMKG
jgi:hypothetical protein